MGQLLLYKVCRVVVVPWNLGRRRVDDALIVRVLGRRGPRRRVAVHIPLSGHLTVVRRGTVEPTARNNEFLRRDSGRDRDWIRRNRVDGQVDGLIEFLFY